MLKMVKVPVSDATIFFFFSSLQNKALDISMNIKMLKKDEIAGF